MAISRVALSGAVFAALVLFSGCPSRTSPSEWRMYRMGERAQVGPLIYTVLDAEWLDQLGKAPDIRMPRNRFVAIRVSVTNSGASTSGVPTMSLLDANGAAHTELTDGTGITDWLGYIRTVKPAETLHGRVLFDVPPASYKLKVTNDAEPEEVRMATVDIPLDLSTAPVVPNQPEPQPVSR